jgi:hypothetical protein
VSARWFRVAYARNAFLRLLAERELALDALRPADGVRAMVAFAAEYRPQHGVLDELRCTWGPTDAGFRFAIARRLQREGQPETPLTLTFVVPDSEARRSTGDVVVTTFAQATATGGYRALARARVLERTLG